MSANKQVVLIHGWSETKSSEAFRSLVDFLEPRGFNAVSLWLGDYISLEDDVRIEDVARRMETAVQSATAPGSNTSYFRNSSRGAAGHVLVHQEESGAPRWLQRNTTHFVKIIIPRVPKDNVFALKPV